MALSSGRLASPTPWRQAARRHSIRATRLAATLQNTALGPQMSWCPHPDAQQRRLEAEALKRQRDRERAEVGAKEAMGLKWWEGTLPPNMIAVLTPAQADMLSARADGGLVLRNFFTEDCYTCRTLHTKLKKIAADNPDVLFLKINGSMSALRPMFEDQNITKVPAFQCVRGGKVRSTFSASLSPEKLARLRAEIAANKNPSFEDADNAAYSTLEH